MRPCTRLCRSRCSIPARETRPAASSAVNGGASSVRYSTGPASARDLRPKRSGGDVTPSKPGVNLVGFVGGERGQGPSVRLGLGEIVRRVARALEHAGVPFATVPYLPSSPRAATFQIDQAVYDTNLICLNADY